MGTEHRTAQSSVAETIDHLSGKATQSVVAACEVAIIEDGGGELSDKNRQAVIDAIDFAQISLREAIDIANAAGKVLKGQPVSALRETSALEVINRLHDGDC